MNLGGDKTPPKDPARPWLGVMEPASKYQQGEQPADKQINEISQGYQKLTFAADSGAFDHVVGEHTLPGYEVKPLSLIHI